MLVCDLLKGVSITFRENTLVSLRSVT